MNRLLDKPLPVAIALAFYGLSVAVNSAYAGTQTNALGDVLFVQLEDLSTLVYDNRKITNATLFLNDFPLKGIHPVAISYSTNGLRFELKRTPENHDQWTLLYKSTPGWQPALTPGVGFEDDPEHVLIPKDGTFYFRKYSGAGWVSAASIIVGITFLLLLIYAAKSNLLRDLTPFQEREFKSQPIPGLAWLPKLGEVRANGRDRPPFSLARVQMAIWFFIIFVCYIFLWLVIGERNNFNGTALTLLGITIATAMISRAIDVSKSAGVSQLQAQKEQLDARQKELLSMPQPLSENLNAELASVKVRAVDLDQKIKSATVPATEHTSEGFFTDILSDENGISLQRLQMLGWTVVLALVFVASVWNNYAMPDFDNTLLGLMGVSSGAFLGFKVPEKKDVPKAQ